MDIRLESRLQWADLTRSFAILTVVLCHAVERIYSLNLAGIEPLSARSKAAAFLAFTFGRLGVPMFLMLSGFLLLDREYDWEGTKRFWKERWLYLLICTEIWFVIYEVFLTVYSKKPLEISTVLADLLFSHKVDMSHVWYLPMIVGMYVLFPFVANALKAYPLKSLILPLCFFGCFALGYPMIKVINGAGGGIPLSLQASLGFSGGAYGIYFVTGYMIKKGWLKRVASWILIAVAALGFLLTVLLQLWAYSREYVYNVWYDCLLLYLCTAAIFELFSRVKAAPLYPVIRWMARYSFAVYLLHNLVIEMVRDRVAALSVAKPVQVVALWGIAVAISFPLAWLVGKIPKIGGYILYLKPAKRELPAQRRQ